MKLHDIKSIWPAIVALAALWPPTAAADTLLLDENFDGDYTHSVAYFFDGDSQQPNRAIASIFYSNTMEAYMPWWVTRDTNTSTDRFFASHSYYASPAASNDWLIFYPVTIASTGFSLEFDAQSVPVRDPLNLSDIDIIITENLVSEATASAPATFTCHEVPFGSDPDNCESDWTHYSFPLDDFVGKTVYVNFVNRNFDSDIVCIDNVRILRHDPATLSLRSIPQYSAGESVEVAAELTATEAEGIGAYTAALYANGSLVKQWHGSDLAKDDTASLVAAAPLAQPGSNNTITFEVTIDGLAWPLTAHAEVTSMSFEPIHRVFVEETTSLFCGNCPMGMYTFESMLDDPLFADRFLPVSVHISAMGFDPMATAPYYANMPISTQAPLVYVERDVAYDGFIPAYDLSYDPENPLTFASRIARKIESPTFLDVDVVANWVIQGNDTTAVACTATVRPAINLTNRNYAIAFILTENNVGLDNNGYWVQENYLSGANVPGGAGGWTALGEFVPNLRYHDVARAISAFTGHHNSLPAKLDMDTDYTFSYTMPIPNTYNSSNGKLLADAIHREFCNVTAIVIDRDTERVINAARVAMSPVANNRIHVADISGVENVAVDTASSSDTPTEYYDLSGRRLPQPPTSGLYIQRTASGATLRR